MNIHLISIYWMPTVCHLHSKHYSYKNEWIQQKKKIFEPNELIVYWEERVKKDTDRKYNRVKNIIQKTTLEEGE